MGYIITYDLDGGTHGTSHPDNVSIDEVINISTPTRTEYTFTGWTATSGLNTSTAKYGSSATSVTTSWTNGSTKVTKNYFKNLASLGSVVTLKANWSGPNHNWVLVSQDVPTSCTDTGTNYYECSTCGETKQTTTYGQHDYVTDRTEPDCTSSGSEVTYCANGCGYYSSRTIPALGHDYRMVAEYDGMYVYECQRCGAYYNSRIT